ncbi:putative bifunctional diguanylate cyclase/phosphodiesterase [Roseomonas elaeocarpi]|uniref:Bifunctional diguanylate cyclase/phosphodiesterase n=1 Tax=Roseomonas elaeocarpi TaxID=907779 RepID=A0ABV6JY66_9PROT
MPAGAAGDPTAAGREARAGAALLRTVEADLAREGWRLHFAPVVEARYESDHREERVAQLRRAVVVGMLCYALYVLADLRLMPDMAEFALVTHIAVAPALSCVALWLLGVLRARWREALLFLCMVLVVAVPATEFWLSDSGLAVFYPISFTLLLIFGGTTLNLRFGWAVSFVAAAVAGLAALMLAKGTMPAAVVAVDVLVLVLVSLFTLLGNWRGEQAHRRAYLLSLLEQLRAQALAAEKVALTSLSTTDALTGVANRRQFDAQFAALLAGREASRAPLSVILLDVDHFKRFNDHYGHLAGDECLRVVAGALRDEMEAGDLLARYGGEEFAAVLPGRGARQGLAIAQRLRRAVERLAIPHAARGDALPVVTVSLGVASQRRGLRGLSPSQLLGRADRALYVAKEGGRNRVADGSNLSGARAQADEGAMAALRDAVALTAALRRALAEDALELRFQPVLPVGGGLPVGFEALVRWNDPERGSVSPAALVRAAEEAGMMAELGRWVLRRACQEARHWPAAVRLGVNISPLELMADGFGAAVAAILRDTGLPPERLLLEITEGMPLRLDGAVAENCRALQQLGVGLVLDDFGAGYCDLSYLRDLPLYAMKIDRLCLDLGEDERVLSTLRALVALAHGFGLRVVLEGIETAHHLALAREAGCDQVQGFHLGRPMVAAAVRRLLDGEAATADRAPSGAS